MMDGKVLARIGAVVFVTLAITATAIDMTRQDEAPRARPAPVVEPSIDPLHAKQRRCQRLGEQAASDTECMAVWAETRDRFLGRSSAPSGAQSDGVR